MGITRSSVIRKAVDELQVMPMPSPEAMDKAIALVYPVNAKYTDVVKRTSTTLTANITVYTTPSDKDFYLTFLQLAITKDVVSDLISCFMQTTILGSATTIGQISLQTLTATSDTLVMTFPHPIKIDRNAAIILAGTFAAGTCTKFISIGGFILE
jgi:hypothetical protein